MIRSAITSSTDVKTINSSWKCYLHDLCSVLFPISFRMLFIKYVQRRNGCGYYNANTVMQNTDVNLRLGEMTNIFHGVWVCGCVCVSGFFVCLANFFYGGGGGGGYQQIAEISVRPTRIISPSSIHVFEMYDTCEASGYTDGYRLLKKFRV